MALHAEFRLLSQSLLISIIAQYSIAPSIDLAMANLQSTFNEFQVALLNSKLVLNANKTKCMLFTRSLNISAYDGIRTLNGEQINFVSTYKYLGIWLDAKLSFKQHIEQLTKKIKVKIGFLYRKKSCFSQSNRKTIVQAVILPEFDYSDLLYMHAASAVLKPLDTVYHSAIRFITGDSFLTHHCTLYENVGWSSLTTRRELHCLQFIFKTLSGKGPEYLSSWLTAKPASHRTRSQTYISLCTPRINSDHGKSAFSFYAPDKWNKLQARLKLDNLISIASFKALLVIELHKTCTCFV